MPEVLKINKEKELVVLTEDDVRNLHNMLCVNYDILEGMEQITPTGVKNINMLSSAVHRQLTGFDGNYLYDDPFTNCATLIFGIVKNHPFHNGNKRAAFICTIKHLYENGYVLHSKINKQEIYDLLLHLAANKLKEHAVKYYKKEYSALKQWNENNNNDEIIKYLAFWLKRSCVSKRIFIKNEIKISELKRILQNKGISVTQNGTTIDLERKDPNESFLSSFFGKKYSIFKRTYGLGNNMTYVKKDVVALIRKDFNLTPEYGVDNVTFYSEEFLDEEIKNYKFLINRLART